MAFGIMIAEYRFRYDEAFMLESMKRYRRHSFRAWRWLLKSIGFLGLAALVWIGVVAKSVSLSVLFVSFMLLLGVAPLFDYWWARIRLRKSPFLDSDIVARLSDTGYYGEDAHSRTELSWKLFTGGRRFSDGFLLFTGPQQFHWFADRCLVTGDVGEVDALLRTKLPKYIGAKQERTWRER